MRLPCRLLVLLLLPALVLACSAGSESHRDPTPVHPNAFDPSLVQAGDSVAGLQVVSLDAQPSEVSPGAWVGTAAFAGGITVSGHAAPHPDGDLVCFFAAASSADRLPRFHGDKRIPWFCFTNQAQARRLPQQEQVRIVVDEYRYMYEHSDVYNTARLVRVLK